MKPVTGDDAYAAGRAAYERATRQTCEFCGCNENDMLIVTVICDGVTKVFCSRVDAGKWLLEQAGIKAENLQPSWS